ncbi:MULTISPECIES: nitrate ABC transporter ATP-binding protein [Pseudanabaena]|jgi:nitrate/nitrite transport system ATP-binding protein|uniref:ABC transporter ATP-binding/substrate-binding protein n=1 Tax=Pseudanabaena TaxID=1152 RepID=UPI0024797D8B|nr:MULTISPECIES: nitrate ABC transporter ATP-binding protein [Pseudanabaena]MEA5485844.1 nitrate ABC transporter ATP-binding protein [Pseudanabaena sp. CCNP1317]WGS72265.1 nitrate ABC transporter ATP-binding protein [Pseudanabaena galeata CCNP1313]
MSKFLEIDHVTRTFKTNNGQPYVAVKDVYFEMKEGEFVSIIGHSGCGKSTVLNILSGLDRASAGGIVLEGREVREPGPDRMLVFQNHSLLPWLTVRQNIGLAVNRVLRDQPKQERDRIIQEHIDLVGLSHAADKYPREISGGMKQRVGIARALSIKPKILLLDEPFGALDALTRGRLQEKLMHICDESKISAVMITHDVDEALLLSDRIVMMTNGPEAKIGQVLTVDLPHPRKRMEAVNHPNYYRLRGEVVNFLDRQKQIKLEKAKMKNKAAISLGSIEKTNLTIGYIPLTDCAPFVIAQEKGLFAKYGLDVTLSKENSWNDLAEGIREGRLDAAQMVTGMPLAISLGMGNKIPVPVVTSLTLSRNGNAITLSNRLHDEDVHDLASLKAYIDRFSDAYNPAIGMVHHASMHNLLLRHWLSSGGIQPDQDVDVIVIPPPQMVSNLMANNIIGYCVGEPWNVRAVNSNVGFVVATDLDIWRGHPEKVLGVRKDWAEQYPHTHLELVKALLEASQFCEPLENRDEVVLTLASPKYLNLDPVYIRPGFAGPYRINTMEAKYEQDFCQFGVGNMPSRKEQLWVLTQMARWGLVTFPENHAEVIYNLLATSVYQQAAKELEIPIIEEDKSPIVLADGSVFDPADPIAALQSMPYSQFTETSYFDPIKGFASKKVAVRQ